MRSILLMLILLLALATPALAQESVLLNVNQTHTLQWDWAQGEEGPLRTFVFQCQYYRKELESDARSLRFGSLIDQPGRYTGCTLSAKNEAGLSAPIIVPDFEYAYSYHRLGIWLVELLALALASGAIMKATGVLFLGWLRQKSHQSAPLALSEPSIILEQERDHVARHH